MATAGEKLNNAKTPDEKAAASREVDKAQDRYLDSINQPVPPEASSESSSSEPDQQIKTLTFGSDGQLKPPDVELKDGDITVPQ